MTAPVIWLVAAASAVLLVPGGFSLAAVRFRARVLARRRQAQQLQGQLDRKSSDPFGELQVIGEQLRRIQERLGQAEEAAGLPVTEPAPAQSQGPAFQGPAPHPADLTAPSPTIELEGDLQLFKHEVYEKTKRIDALVAEKQRLAEKIVGLESALAAQAAAPPQPPSAPTKDAPPGHPSYGGMALVDVLQQEADELRSKIDEQDRLIKALEAQDSTGLVHELERIRTELRTRNEELAAFDVKLNRAAKKTEQHQSRVQVLEREKETLASKALDASAQLRQANERVRVLEQQLALKGPAENAGPPSSASYPAVSRRPAPARQTPPPSPSQTPPPVPPRSAPLPPPAPKEQRPRSGIFPAPRSKKDLID